VDETEGRVGYMGEITNAYKIVVGSMAKKRGLFEDIDAGRGGGGGGGGGGKGENN